MKKISLWGSARWFVVAVLLLFSLTTFARMAGDIDNDDQITAKDILLLQKFLIGTATPTSEEDQVADVAPLNSPDGQLTASDLLVLQKGLLGFITLPLFPDSPTFDSIPSSTTTNPLPIAGVAGANNEVRLYVNGELQSTTTSAGDGSFTINAILADGTNDIYVTQWDGVYESLNPASQIVAYQNTVNPITAALVASRVSGPAPLAVHFDATGTTHINGDVDPWRHVGYYFDYDDPTSGTWAISGQSKNIDFGAPLGGHVFETPGEYLVGVRALLGEDFDDAWVTITVADPDVVYAGTATVCITTSANFDGVTLPSGCAEVTTITAWSQLPGGGLQSNTRYLFRRGESFVSLGTVDINGIENFQMGAIGTGSKPQLGAVVVNHPSTAVFVKPQNFVLMDIDFDRFHQEKMARDYLLLRNTFDSPGHGVSFGGALSHYTSNQPGSIPYTDWVKSSGIAIIENYINMAHTLDKNSGTNGIGGTGSGIFIAGNQSDDADEHGMRIFNSYKAYVKHNACNGDSRPGGKHAIKMHSEGTLPWQQGVTVGATSTRYLAESRYIVVGQNTLGGPNNDAMILQVAPQDDSSSGTVEYINDVIVEANDFTNRGAGTIFDIHFLGSRMIRRGNTGSSSYWETSYPSDYSDYDPLYSSDRHGPYYSDAMPTTQPPVRN